MIKLLLTLLMMFTFGTSIVNAEENTTSIEDRISELVEIKPDRQSSIKAKVDELSEDELEKVIENVNELTEQTEDDLAIKEAAISKLEEMKEERHLAVGVVIAVLVMLFTPLIMLFTGYTDKGSLPILFGVLLVVVILLLTMWWVQNW